MIKLLAQRVFFQRPTFAFANLKEKMERRQEKKQRDQYKEELEHLASKPQFTLIDMRQRAVDGLHKLKKGLKYKISSGNEETEQQLTLQKQILNAFFDEELLNPDLITATKKKEIAMVSQTKVEDVNKIIKQYEHMQNLHSWVRTLKERGEPMPQDQDELMYQFRKDRPMKKSFLKFEHRHQSYSKKQRLQKMKWGLRKQV